MAGKKNKTQSKEIITPAEKTEKIKEAEEVKKAEETKSTKKEEPKYSIGSIVYVSKDADADLKGFKLFPQYKKYTYTVEAYDEKSDVYTLRRLNLSLYLPGSLILAPEERAHDKINRLQF